MAKAAEKVAEQIGREVSLPVANKHTYKSIQKFNCYTFYKPMIY